jgi:PAS domain S-box-containing protein
MTESSGSRGRWRRAWRSTAVGALFAAILATQLAESDALVFWGLLYVVPVVLVAIDANRRWGLAAGGLAVILVAAWAQINGVDLDVSDYAACAGAFLVVGWVAGGDARRSAAPCEGADVVSPLAPAAPRAAPDRSREPDARPREALRLAGLGTWELSIATGEIDWSEEFHDLYGVDPREFVASRRAFQEIVHREDREIFDRALDGIIRDGDAVEIRYRIIRPSDGAQRCIRSHIRALSDSGGRPLWVLGTGQDVTDLVLVLSPREREMLMMLAEGLSGEEIAARLVLSPATVRTHVQNAMVKLGAHTRGQAIALALRRSEIGS